jgi:hypothetical protein
LATARVISQPAIILAAAGAGAVAPDLFAQGLPEVDPVLPDWPGIPVPLWRIAHRALLTSRRIRIVHDFLAEAIVGTNAVP